MHLASRGNMHGINRNSEGTKIECGTNSEPEPAGRPPAGDARSAQGRQGGLWLGHSRRRGVLIDLLYAGEDTCGRVPTLRAGAGLGVGTLLGRSRPCRPACRACRVLAAPGQGEGSLGTMRPFPSESPIPLSLDQLQHLYCLWFAGVRSHDCWP